MTPVADVLAPLRSATLDVKRAVVRFAVAANMQPHYAGLGKGNAARKREERAGMALVFSDEPFVLPLSCQDVDRLAELVGESRSLKHHYRTNIHGD